MYGGKFETTLGVRVRGCESTLAVGLSLVEQVGVRVILDILQCFETRGGVNF